MTAQGRRRKAALPDPTPRALFSAVVAARNREREECAKLAEQVLRACISDEERDIATTIRDLILARGLRGDI